METETKICETQTISLKFNRGEGRGPYRFFFEIFLNLFLAVYD
jgi:hypothetical protein